MVSSSVCWLRNTISADGAAFFDMACRFQAIHAGHIDIEDHDIRLKMFGLHNGVYAIRRIANNFKIGLRLQERAGRLPSDGMIVNDENLCRSVYTRPVIDATSPLSLELYPASSRSEKD